jgi:hypothetical protein
MTIKESLKRVAKKMPGPHLLLSWWLLFLLKRKQGIEIKKWKTGATGFPPHIIKQRTLRSYAKKHHLSILVETGTYYGDMVAAMQRVFDRIYTIELSTDLYERAKLRFAAHESIEVINGDSGVELEKLLPRIDRPALFWLDGHYSGGETVRGERDTPIFEELRHILGAPDRGHVIIIDDARLFGKDPGYPALEDLKKIVYSLRKNSEIHVADDMIRITPQP